MSTKYAGIHSHTLLYINYMKNKLKIPFNRRCSFIKIKYFYKYKYFKQIRENAIICYI